MYTAINAWTFSDTLSPSEQIVAAAGAGFAGIELTVGFDAPLTPETPLHTFGQLATVATDAGVRIAGLATGLYWELNFGADEAAERERARDVTCYLLDRAAAVGAGALLVVPAVVGKADDARERIGYAEAYNRTLEALNELRYEAESRGVLLAIENVWNRFLLSPMEAAGLIDQVNSPNVGWYFDVGNVLAYGYPTDWIRTLGGRIVRVHMKDYDVSRPGWAGFCELGAGSVDWPAVVEALRDVGYQGPLTYEGPGQPADVRRRLENILTGRAPA